MNIKVIEPIRNYLQEFETPQDFSKYYEMNKDEMNKWTTQKLNKSLHVKGYRITKIKGEIMLKAESKKKINELDEKMDYVTSDQIAEILDERLKDIENNDLTERFNERIMALERQIDKITSAMNKIIKQINEM